MYIEEFDSLNRVWGFPHDPWPCFIYSKLLFSGYQGEAVHQDHSPAFLWLFWLKFAIYVIKYKWYKSSRHFNCPLCRFRTKPSNHPTICKPCPFKSKRSPSNLNCNPECLQTPADACVPALHLHARSVCVDWRGGVRKGFPSAFSAFLDVGHLDDMPIPGSPWVYTSVRVKECRSAAIWSVGIPARAC